MSQENVEIFNAVFTAWKARDMERVLGLFDPDLELDFSGTQFGDLIPRVGRGHDGARNIIRDWYEAWEEHREELTEAIDAGDHVISVIMMRGRGRASGANVELESYVVWTVRDGRIVRIVGFETRERAFAAAGLPQ